MFNSLIGIATDIVKVVAAPVEIVADVTRAITKPIADAAQEVVQSVKEEISDDHAPK
jgi:hypothetical protein